MFESFVGIAEAKNNLSVLINRVTHGNKRIILQSRGKPKAAVISIGDFQRLEELEKGANGINQLEILKRAKRLREKIFLRRKSELLSDSSALLYELRKEQSGG